MMPDPELLTVALLLWSAGASFYTWQLWAARGLTDHGFLGLAGLILGATAMAVALREVPTLALCALFPAYFAAAILVVKVRARIRVRWHRPPPEMPAMLPREPEQEMPITPEQARVREWLAIGSRAESPAEYAGRMEREVPLIRSETEAERAQRMAKMFG